MVTTLERPRSTVEKLTTPRPPRTSRRRRLLGVLVGLVALVSLVAVPLGFGLVPAIYQPPLPRDAAFAVGRQVVTVQEYDDRMKTVKALYGAEEPTDPAGSDQFRRASAKALATAQVMANAEAAKGIVIPDNKVRDSLSSQVAQRFGPGPDGYKKFTDSLAQVGSSETKLIEEMRQQMASAELVNQVTANVSPSPQEIKDAYPRYAAKLGDPEQRRLSNIVVTTPEQANDILTQIRAGRPFADLARQFSIDPATKDAGGDLGMMTQDKLQPTFAGPAFATPKGQPFGPVQTDAGWNVGLVVDVVPGKPATYDEAEIPLQNAVTAEKKLNVWRDFLAKQLHDAHLRFADAYRPADPAGVPAALGPPQ